MTAEAIRDLRHAILRELYRIDPRGRTVRGLHTLIVPSVPSSEPENIQEQVRFLLSLDYIEKLPMDELAANDDPYYAITDKGCRYSEEKRIV